MIWWKNRFEAEEEELLSVYCTQEMRDSLINFLATDEKIQKKSGTALAKGKATHLWTTFIKNDKPLKAKIKTDFDQARSEFEKNNKTPASKENSTPPSSAEGKTATTTTTSANAT